jgi:hypothetical protein
MMNTQKKSRKEKEERPMRYWLVEITLTSGDGLQFYVSAINQEEAYRKADGYAELAENEGLQKRYKEFQLLP